MFLHDNESYQNKTSGLLWIAAWYRLPAVFLRSSWLTREAFRLGLPFAIAGQESLIFAEEHDLIVPSSGYGEEEICRYRHILYRPFWEWARSGFEEVFL